MAMTIPRHLIDVDVSEAARADRRGISAKKRISTFLSIITSSRSNISRVGAQENAGCGLVAQDSLRGISYTDYVPSRAYDILAEILQTLITNQSAEDTDNVTNAE